MNRLVGRLVEPVVTFTMGDDRTYLGRSLHAKPGLGEDLGLTLGEDGATGLAVLLDLVGRHVDD